MPNVDEYMIMLEFTNQYNYYFILCTIVYPKSSKISLTVWSRFPFTFCSPPRCAKWSRDAMVTHSLAVPVPGKRVAACSAAQPKRWSCVAGRRDASTKSTSLYSSPRLPPWAWKVMMLMNHHHRFCWFGNVGAVPFGFFVDTFGKHGVIFIHNGPCCYRCFSNGAIFPDYSYESMDLRILRFLDMPRSEDNNPLDDLRRKPLLHMPTWSAYFPQKRTWKLYMQTLITTASSIIINHICNHILWILHKHCLTVDHEGWWCSSHIT